MGGREGGALSGTGWLGGVSWRVRVAGQPAAGPGAAVAERDVLLATKLHVPGPRPGLIPRLRLADRLDQGLDSGMVLVSAPAGYGKTVLLADWVRRGQRPVAWRCLGCGDNDPARLWPPAVTSPHPA